ncbi:MAG TPA: 4Fe-4S dicluster domain-containing protein [Euzebyales bacterium]|nr:4Fe-4S dicluster domain-containing protein [Euzebyales bacterium]
MVDVMDAAALADLLDGLGRQGYTVVGPTVGDGAIVYDELDSVDDLPRGWTDEQAPGHYRLAQRDDDALFGYAVGPHSWKRYLLPSTHTVWSAERTDDGGLRVLDEPTPAPRYAFVGVRSCELAAIAVQDRVFIQGPAVDTVYARRRDEVLLIAVNCGDPAGTCFCVSMGTGPRATGGFDLALTEVLDDDGHRFVVEVGTDAGRAALDAAAHRPATADDAAAAHAVTDRAAQRMGRVMDTTAIKELLYGNLEHPRWDDVASRCLACGNCTMACPTCFCTSVTDVTDLSGEHVERHRDWDSCFTLDFTWTAGTSVRSTTRSRYRQWMTHKLATWIDQFGTSGCVGCGRCITWCPVGIDITEEVAAIRADDPIEDAEDLP